MITLKTEVDAAGVISQFRRFHDKEFPLCRRTVVEEIAGDVLSMTIERNPVDTGRSRSAWVASLAQLGETAPAGWQGPHPVAAALSEGAGRASLDITHDAESTTITITTAVPYVAFLEDGTRAMAPFLMVTRSLSQVRSRLADLLAAALHSIKQ